MTRAAAPLTFRALALIGGLVAAFTGLSAALAGGAAAREPNAAAPALWRVADADTEVILFGSVHLLPNQLEWRTDALDRAARDADIVYLEAPNDASAQQRVVRLVQSKGFLAPGERLTDLLSVLGGAALSQRAAELGVPRGDLETMRPWFAAIVLSLAVLERMGASPEAGVDKILEAEAVRDGKTLRYFETPEQQIALFADVPMALQIEALEATLEQLADEADSLNTMFAAWRVGDLGALADVVFEGFETLPPIYYESLFTRRNAAWTDTLETLMRTEAGSVLVVVGAGHLIGPDSVVEMLRARGFEVERL